MQRSEGASFREPRVELASTTLSDPKLKRPLFRLLHPVHVSRATDEEQACKDLLYERADLRKRQPGAGVWPAAFALEKRVGHRADDHVVLPPGIGPAFEVIEAEFGFEILVVLFDRPALMGQADELGQGGRRGQRDEVMLAAPGRAHAAFAQEPNLGGEPPLAPIGRRRDPPRAVPALASLRRRRQ